MQYIDDLITRLAYKCVGISPSGVDVGSVTADTTIITSDTDIITADNG